MKSLISSFLAAAIAAPVAAQDALLRVLPTRSELVCWLQLDALRDLIGPELLREARRHIHLDFGTEAAGTEAAGDDSLERFSRRWGFDPIADVGSVAVIGSPPGPSVLAARTNARIDVLLERLRASGACEPAASGGVELLRLPAAKLARALGALPPPDQPDTAMLLHRLAIDDHTRVLLLGQDAAAVAALAGAMRDPREPAALPPGMRPGCLLFVAVRGPIANVLGDDPHSRVLQKANDVSLQFAEHDGELRLTASIDTGDVRDARQIAAVVNGLKALATLLAPEDAEVPEVLVEAWHRAAASADGKAVRLDVAVASDVLRRALHELARDRARPPATRETGK
ncbi:MAG TPA: hypothetical protein VFD82_15055 [Planctomycetota bacterium]|nr:hypothetical protein [Planctomycetota bacterium]